MTPDLSALRGNETILVVEDDETVRRFTVHMLTTLGYRVIEAMDGREALARCQEDAMAIDLVLTDMIMPHMTGKQFVEQLRRLGKTFRVLFVSGYSAEDTVDGQTLGDGIAFFAKPYTRNQLATKIREVLDKPAT